MVGLLAAALNVRAQGIVPEVAPPPAPVKEPLGAAAGLSAGGANSAANTIETPAGQTKGLYFSPGPANGEDIARRELRLPLPNVQIDAATVKIRPGLPSYTLPTDAYGVPTVNVTKEGQLDFAPVLDTWMYLVESGGKVVSEATERIASPGVARSSSYGAGRAAATAQMLDQAAALDRVQAGRYEARVLVVFGSRNTRSMPQRTDVLWLKSDSGGPDLIYNGGLVTAEAFLQSINGRQSGGILGIVLDQAGQPVPHAKISYSRNGNVLSGTAGGETDDHGAFAIRNLTPGTQYGVSASANGQSGYWQPVEVQAGMQTKLPAPITLAAAGSISGIVLGKDGKPAANAAIGYIQIAPEVGREIVIDSGNTYVGGNPAGTTDAQGQFTLKELPRGLYVVTAVVDLGAGIAPQLASMQPVEVKSGGETKLPQPLKLLPTGSISGTVLDMDGKPAASATIYVILNPSADQHDLHVKPDAAGAFLIQNIPPGQWRVEASIAGSNGIRPQNQNANPVEVKPGTETKLPGPINLRETPVIYR